MHIRTLEEWIMKRLRGRGSVGGVRKQCPYCNATLEVLTAEWLCLNGQGLGIPDKDHTHKCKDTDTVPFFMQAPNFWGKSLNRGLAELMKRMSYEMHIILKMPIETSGYVHPTYNQIKRYSKSEKANLLHEQEINEKGNEELETNNE
jgi:hypothetical protein